MVRLGSVGLDRAAGVLLGQACGDALGVHYEFRPPMPSGERAYMLGSAGFGFEAGEWSDDTEMALCIASVVAAAPRPLRDEDVDRIAERFVGWAIGSAAYDRWARDVGNQTVSVLGNASAGPGPRAEACRRAAAAYSASGGRPGAGNGALMRTGVLALVYPADRDATAELVRRVAALTHAADDVEDSCVLWTEAVRSAMARDWGTDEAFAPELLLDGLDLIPGERRSKWERLIRDATGADPVSFGKNGYTVITFQVAWAAITSTPVPALDPAAGSFPCRHLEHALDAVVHAGWDTDTSAAAAGQLLGACWGASAVPAKWIRLVHGRGLDDGGTYQACMRPRDLIRLSAMTVKAGAGAPVAPAQWPRGDQVPYPMADTPRVALPHPADEQVRIGGMASLDHGCDAAVSACRVGRAEPLLAGMAEDDRVELLLVDDDGELKNPNLHFVIDDGARAACQLRHEGRRVLIHCVNAESRSPAVAARYGVLRGRKSAKAQREVKAALDAWRGEYTSTPRLWRAVAELGDARAGCDQCPYRDGAAPVPVDPGAFHPCV